jgi:hypothetical protein
MPELIDAMPSRHRDLVAQVIAPSSKLATARGLRAETCQEVAYARSISRRNWSLVLPGGF